MPGWPTSRRRCVPDRVSNHVQVIRLDCPFLWHTQGRLSVARETGIANPCNDSMQVLGQEL